MSVPNDEIDSMEQDHWRFIARQLRRRIAEIAMSDLTQTQVWELVQAADAVRRFDLSAHAFDAHRDSIHANLAKGYQ